MGWGPWNLPLNQQPQVNPLQLVSESMTNSLENLGLSAHTPNPAETPRAILVCGQGGCFLLGGDTGPPRSGPAICILSLCPQMDRLGVGENGMTHCLWGDLHVLGAVAVS